MHLYCHHVLLCWLLLLASIDLPMVILWQWRYSVWCVRVARLDTATQIKREVDPTRLALPHGREHRHQTRWDTGPMLYRMVGLMRWWDTDLALSVCSLQRPAVTNVSLTTAVMWQEAVWVWTIIIQVTSAMTRRNVMVLWRKLNVTTATFLILNNGMWHHQQYNVVTTVPHQLFTW